MNKSLCSFLLVITLLFWGDSACLAAPSLANQFVKGAIALENTHVVYDSTYRKISYPMGDVAPNFGVCADVVIRFRSLPEIMGSAAAGQQY